MSKRRNVNRTVGRVAAAQRGVHERWLKEITALPTAAGHEKRVIDYVKTWVSQRRQLRSTVDRAGNMVIVRRANRRMRVAPLFITAHLDHPAFVVREVLDDGHLELEFRGGVHNPYFENAAIEIIPSGGMQQTSRARITAVDAAAKPFKRVTARLEQREHEVNVGDIARWRFERESVPLPRVDNGLLYTHACDDLAAVAAALSAYDIIHRLRGCKHVGLLFTRAEEVGFIGAIAACKHKTVPKSARLICLENSRSFPTDSPIGAGPIVRVGDRLSVFEPTLTNQISSLVMEHQKANPSFKFQRKLMPGGACEATTFSAYGYKSTCLCLPLGNYHNMTDIDGVMSGSPPTRPARVGPEFISIDDYHGLIDMLILCATKLDASDVPSLKLRMENLYREYKDVLELDRAVSE
jgi:endoglucanase